MESKRNELREENMKLQAKIEVLQQELDTLKNFFIETSGTHSGKLNIENCC